eukprot:15330107-Alexandrium_andersonii.AAC.1
MSRCPKPFPASRSSSCPPSAQSPQPTCSGKAFHACLFNLIKVEDSRKELMKALRSQLATSHCCVTSARLGSRWLVLVWVGLGCSQGVQ